MLRNWLFWALLAPNLFVDGSLQPLPLIQPLGRGAQRAQPEVPTTASLDSLTIVGSVPDPLYDAVAFGDTDHDGDLEVFLGALGGGEHADIYEYSPGTSTWVLAGTVPFLFPFAIGDVDQDGNADVVGQVGSVVRVVESPNSTSFPSILKWQSPSLSSVVGYPEIADTDGDGRQEILHTINGGASRLVIYECTGNDTYTQRYLSPVEFQFGGRKLIGDFNGNGKIDIATSGDLGYLRIIESQGDDSWLVTFSDSTGLVNAYALSGGADTDADGTPEIFVSGDDPELPQRHTIVFQAAGSSFQRVTTLTVADGSLGEANGLAVLEPGGVPVFAWMQVTPRRLQLYRSTQPATWELASEVFDPTSKRSKIHVYDMNRNGRDEIYWMSCCSGQPSWILERRTSATDTQNSLPGGSSVRLSPNPGQGSVTAFLRPDVAAIARNWSLYDVAGRRLNTARLRTRSSGVLLDMGNVLPGIYFVSIEDAALRPISVGRAVVVRKTR